MKTNWISEARAAVIAKVTMRTIRYWRLRGFIPVEDTMTIPKGAGFQRVYAESAIRNLAKNGVPR